MSDGIKPTKIESEGYALPDEVSIDGDYVGDDVDWDSSPGMLGFDQWKQPVRAATTASVTIATALNNGDTIDGVTLATGDRVLVKDQGASAEQNGIYIVGVTPARADDLDEDAEVLGAVVYVIDGTANAGTVWTCTNIAATVVDTDDIDWAQLSGGSAGITVEDEGTPLSTAATTLDFVGAGVTASGSGTTKTITIAGGSGITVEDEGTPLSTAADTLDFVGAGVTATGSGTTKTITIPGGGGGITAKVPVQEKAASGSSSNSQAVTMDATPTNGNLLILCSANEGANNISSITQTNVSWSKVAESTASTAPHAEIWKGVVSASAGTTVTVAYSGTATCGFVVSEWNGITGTLDQSAAVTNQSQTTGGNKIPTITPTDASAIVVFCGAETTYTTYFFFGGTNLMPFNTGAVNSGSVGNLVVVNSYAAAFAFLGTNPVYGKVFNSHGGTFSGVTVSIT